MVRAAFQTTSEQTEPTKSSVCEVVPGYHPSSQSKIRDVVRAFVAGLTGRTLSKIMNELYWLPAVSREMFASTRSISTRVDPCIPFVLPPSAMSRD